VPEVVERTVRVKRAYEATAPEDGFRVLVDRLWPRGLRRDGARIDLWLKDVAPSAALRTWWGHDPARGDEFAARYRAELRENPALETLRGLVEAHPVVTLLFAAHAAALNNAVVLRDVLDEDA
jgi:uncharacterized protein YeaO (DUF488 family)